MPKCSICYTLLPSEFVEPIDVEVKGNERQPYKCVWCKNDTKVITVNKTEGGTYKYTREQCAREYVEFLNELKYRAQKKGASAGIIKG